MPQTDALESVILQELARVSTLHIRTTQKEAPQWTGSHVMATSPSNIQIRSPASRPRTALIRRGAPRNALV
jgi:hypothetical protein